MEESLLPALASIIVVGIAAQWLASRVGLPSILLLLTFGLIAGPVTGWIRPDELFGDLLFPLISISVALILYEGGLSLKFSELGKVGGVVLRLVSVGAMITWVITGLAAHLILGLEPAQCALLGAILVVTGPTVVAPLLRHIRPTGAVGPTLKWEGIVIDPIGAIMAVLIFEAILSGGPKEAAAQAAVGIAKTVLFGGGLGFVAAAILVLLLERHWIAEHLQSAVSLMLVVAAFAGANELQEEAGLLAVTVMGVVLANQRRADVRHIVEFKENLRVLLISILFVALAARLDREQLTSAAGRGLAFVAVLVLVARPLAVWCSTFRSPLTLKERMFLAWMAPRGIVAAAVSSVFALKLAEHDIPGAEVLVSITFMTIIATVAIYGITSPIVARRLGVAEAHPQGIVMVGAQDWARAMAELLMREGFRVLVVDSNRANIAAARMAGLPTYSGSILADYALDEIDLGGMGRLLALTPNDWVNILTVQRFESIFSRRECYQLSPHQQSSAEPGKHKFLHGRRLFDDSATYAHIARCHQKGFTPKATGLTEEFDFESFRERYGPEAIPLFVVTREGRLEVVTSEHEQAPQPGQKLISLVPDDSRNS